MNNSLREELLAQKVISDNYTALAVSKKYGMLCSGEKGRVLNFHGYLHNPDTVLDSSGAAVNFALNTYWKVSDPCKELLAERMQGLKASFAKDIFARGLYAAAQDSPAGTVMSMKDGVLVSCEKKDGAFEFNVTKGKSGTEGYRLMTFTCNSEDPTTLALTAFNGKHADLEELMAKAAERFHDIRKGYAVMRAPGTFTVKEPVKVAAMAGAAM